MRCAYELTGPCRQYAYGPEALCEPCKANGGPLPEPPCRCGKPRAEGTKLCEVCLAKSRETAAIARAARTNPRREGEKVCGVCRDWKPLGDYFRDSRNKLDGRTSTCKTCAEQRRMARRRASGVLPMRLRPPVAEDGTRWCSRCDDWMSLASFCKNSKNADGLASWCKPCCAEAWHERKETGSVCSCGRGKQREAKVCESCLDADGRTGPEAQVISALRVLGGEAQMAAVVEDIGGDINEDPNSGPGYRRAYRGMAALRKRGLAETRGEKAELATRGGEIVTHRLKEQR